MTNEEIVKKIEALEKAVEELKAHSPAAYFNPLAHLLESTKEKEKPF